MEHQFTIIYVFTLAILWTWESIAPFFEKPKNRLKHDARNLAIGALNGIVLAVVFARIITESASMATERGIGLLHLFAMPAWLHGSLAFLILDAWTYASHRLYHTIPFLWRFHRVHHSDNAMDATSAVRFHTGEILISMSVRVLVVFLIGAPIAAIVLYDMVMVVCTLFHHANIALPATVDRILRYITVSPFMHKVHHSRYQPETDSNFSTVFSIWDRLFGSYREREEYATLRLGLDGYDAEAKQTLPGLFRTPFE